MVGKSPRCLLMAVAFNISLAAAAWADTGRPFSLHREDVDASSYPWSAIGKLFNEAGNTCTGVIISRKKILTAAHCIYNDRTQRFVRPDALHFLVGYRSGRTAAHARVASYEIGSGYDPSRWRDTLESDWVILTLADSLPADIAPLKLRQGSSPSGTKAFIAGYPKDRAHAMTADLNCELRGEMDKGRLVSHTCRGMQGYSGAPILVRTGHDEFQVAGIHIATIRGEGTNRMLAVPAKAIVQRNSNGADDGRPKLAVNSLAAENLEINSLAAEDAEDLEMIWAVESGL